ncbi:MAG TPA: hypothetical protein VKV77_00840 [Methylovirgula sp.]|nr:hypothetical protein [Methylovirgula sp.]
MRHLPPILALGAAVLLTGPVFGQTGLPPSLIQSPPMAFPESSPAQPSDQAPAPASPAPASPAPPPAPAQAAQAAKAKPPAKTAARKPAAKHIASSKAKGAHAPRDVVREIYKVAAGSDGDYSGPSAFLDEHVRHLYFSKELIAGLAALSKKSGGAGINFDPITNSAGSDVEDLDIAVESQTPDHVIVAAKFSSGRDSSIVHYDFVKEAGGWKIDDIRGEIVGQNGQWSLREIIKDNLQPS